MLKQIFPHCKTKKEDLINKTLSLYDIESIISTYSIACEYDNNEMRCKELLNGHLSTVYFDPINRCVRTTPSYKSTSL